jgi:hypothetical protein
MRQLLFQDNLGVFFEVSLSESNFEGVVATCNVPILRRNASFPQKVPSTPNAPTKSRMKTNTMPM